MHKNRIMPLIFIFILFSYTCSLHKNCLDTGPWKDAVNGGMYFHAFANESQRTYFIS